MKGTPGVPSRNTSTIRAPKWTGEGNEIAISVSRGEPRRDNEQMVAGVTEQMATYLREIRRIEISDAVIAKTIELIAKDYIYPVGSGFVWLYYEHLMLFVQKANMLLSLEEQA